MNDDATSAFLNTTKTFLYDQLSNTISLKSVSLLTQRYQENEQDDITMRTLQESFSSALIVVLQVTGTTINENGESSTSDFSGIIESLFISETELFTVMLSENKVLTTELEMFASEFVMDVILYRPSVSPSLLASSMNSSNSSESLLSGTPTNEQSSFVEVLSASVMAGIGAAAASASAAASSSAAAAGGEGESTNSNDNTLVSNDKRRSTSTRQNQSMGNSDMTTKDVLKECAFEIEEKLENLAGDIEERLSAIKFNKYEAYTITRRTVLLSIFIIKCKTKILK